MQYHGIQELREDRDLTEKQMAKILILQPKYLQQRGAWGNGDPSGEKGFFAALRMTGKRARWRERILRCAQNDG